MKYGYARVSSVGQDLTIQVQKLNEVGCDVIREEKVSGTSLKGRKEFETLMEFMRKGDELVVTRIDRLARSIRDLQNIVYELKNKGELRRCSRTLGYFTPVHERGAKWDNIEEHIPTISRQAPLIGFMNLAQLKAA
jgi:hypothetical protein